MSTKYRNSRVAFPEQNRNHLLRSELDFERNGMKCQVFREGNS
jgi:hypothetical protein